MNRKLIAATILLVAIILISVFAVMQLWDSKPEPAEFYVGVEVAYANATASDVKVMVDRVKDYTNLIVIGAPEVSLNQTSFNELCDYINSTGLHFVVLFAEFPSYSYNTFAWMTEARQRYGENFLGVYRYDEPGGNTIDMGPSRVVLEAANYSDAATRYVEALKPIVEFYEGYAGQVFTADYALQWFDYKLNYSAVFSEFTANHTREIAIAECRGAAANFGKDWGVMVTWKYDVPPYIESGEELLDGLISAYKAGAKYAIVFDHPKLDTYGILEDEHFEALQQFWDYVHDNPQDFGSQKGKVVYILPEDYGFGLRRANDKIWGVFEADGLSAKVWNDVNKLTSTYGFGLDIIYDEHGVVDAARNRYERLIFWNETVT